MIWPEDMQPPYRDEPSLPRRERARRLACRVMMWGEFVTVKPGMKKLFFHMTREMDARLLALGSRDSREVCSAAARAYHAEFECD